MCCVILQYIYSMRARSPVKGMGSPNNQDILRNGYFLCNPDSRPPWYRTKSSNQHMSARNSTNGMSRMVIDIHSSEDSVDVRKRILINQIYVSNKFHDFVVRFFLGTKKDYSTGCIL